MVGGEENGEDDGFSFVFLGSTQVFFRFFLILFNLMWHLKTQVPRHVALVVCYESSSKSSLREG